MSIKESLRNAGLLKSCFTNIQLQQQDTSDLLSADFQCNSLKNAYHFQMPVEIGKFYYVSFEN